MEPSFLRISTCSPSSTLSVIPSAITSALLTALALAPGIQALLENVRVLDVPLCQVHGYFR